MTTSTIDIKILRTGIDGSNDFRIYFFIENDQQDEIKFISPWYDIPYKNNDQTYTFVVEIPYLYDKKMEMSKSIIKNPIRQDIRNGKLRTLHMNIPFNYGFIPQTWEDPSCIDKHTKYKGDNDPIDVIELTDILNTFIIEHNIQLDPYCKSYHIGQIVKINVIDILEVIDEEETDWKVISFDSENNLYNQLDLKQQDEFKSYAKNIISNFYLTSDKTSIIVNNLLGSDNANEIIEYTNLNFRNMLH